MSLRGASATGLPSSASCRRLLLCDPVVAAPAEPLQHLLSVVGAVTGMVAVHPDERAACASGD